ncbi:MAG: NADH-dependent [FeFe] hydrogenase, group A6 [Defluviitaleaceae bacterium]|nr:NADH-dependent [FeFe] hydrogenase, group A6 [Defluviitaleaceae bacterium]
MKVNLMIDNIKVEAVEGDTILQAAKSVGVEIPTLCFLKDMNEVGACRVCLVEVEGARSLLAACVQQVSEGMVVHTKTQKVRDARKSTVELILSNHNRECLTCERNRKCELQYIAEGLGISEIYFDGEKTAGGIYDDASPSVVRDQTKCILCGRCINVCNKQQNVGILDFQGRGINAKVGPTGNRSLTKVPCLYCGQCINVCPVGALKEKEDIDRLWKAIEDPTLHVIVQTAPAVRTALGEEFNMPIGTRVTGKMVTALRRLGFNKVYDTNFAADLTIMEEGHELLGRIKNNGVLPMLTSCSPGWVRFLEFNYPELIPHLSTAKSPHMMMGALLKTYYSKQHCIDPASIFVVSVMPCTAKKAEAARPEMEVAGLRDVDCVITTRELAKMIKQARINFATLPDNDFDKDLMGEYTGAGAIFGTTGGVMEAAIRTVADVLSGEDLKEFEYNAVRGTAEIKESNVNVAGTTIKIAVAHSTGAATVLLEKIKRGEADYHFIEVMCCSGGCVNGGGQPRVANKDRLSLDIRKERTKAIYQEDESRLFRKSHKNPDIKKLYSDFLESPNSHIAHELLHTTYHKMDKYPE